jgi:hypothetical protein
VKKFKRGKAIVALSGSWMDEIVTPIAQKDQKYGDYVDYARRDP